MKSEKMEHTYHGLLGLDKLPKVVKALNWGFCFLITTYAGIVGYFHLELIIRGVPMRAYFDWLAIISPICIAVAWLRLTGVKWLHTLLLFIFVPLAVIGIRLSFELIFSISLD